MNTIHWFSVLCFEFSLNFVLAQRSDEVDYWPLGIGIQETTNTCLSTLKKSYRRFVVARPAITAVELIRTYNNIRSVSGLPRDVCTRRSVSAFCSDLNDLFINKVVHTMLTNIVGGNDLGYF